MHSTIYVTTASLTHDQLQQLSEEVGADRILSCVKQRLGIDLGQTTADGKFSLGEVECLASCGTGPMMQINDDYWENLTPERTLEIIDRLARE